MIRMLIVGYCFGIGSFKDFTTPGSPSTRAGAGADVAIHRRVAEEDAHLARAQRGRSRPHFMVGAAHRVLHRN